MDPFDNLLWAYRAVFTQAGAGGGNVRINIAARERTVILFGSVGPDDYAAGRDVSGWVAGDDGTTILRIMYGTSADNIQVPLLTDSQAALVNNQGPELQQQLVLGKGDTVKVQATSLVQNETLTIAIRALCRSWPPTVTTTGSSGTVTVATTYDEVK